MAFINQGRHIGTVGLTASVLMDLDIKCQGNSSCEIPDHGGSGSLGVERELFSKPSFQINETITGSTNSYTSIFAGVSLMGTSELADSVGGGGGGPSDQQAGYGGGSGGGGSTHNHGSTAGGISIPGQGNDGGGGGDRNEASGASGGGGGRGAAGTAGSGSTAGAGGNGATNNFRTGSNITYAGGGGGAGGNTTPTSIGAGGTGGGGTGVSGTVNTGGGGGTGNSPASNGGSGIVVLRYDTSQVGFSLSGGTENTYSLGGVDYQSHTFLSSGVLVATGSGDIDALIISGGGGAGGHGGDAEGGNYRGGGGAGGMFTDTDVGIVAGTYAVSVGAGGIGGGPGQTGSSPTTRTGNLSWVTPRRTISVANPTGVYVTGETLTGGTSGATGDVIIYYS